MYDFIDFRSLQSVLLFPYLAAHSPQVEAQQCLWECVADGIAIVAAACPVVSKETQSYLAHSHVQAGQHILQ
jgi:hypothetical protein